LAGGLTRAAARAVGWAPVALVVVAEAAWIAVVGGLLQEFAFGEPVLGIPAIAVFVVAGILLARVLGQRLGRRWPGVALALIVAAGFAGLVASPAARLALADGPGAALARHPGGLVAGLALLRGFAHAELPLLEGTIARLLGLGVPGIAVAAILGGVIGEPFRGRFLADTLGASITFIVAATLALALTRLTAIGGDSGFDWRRNPTWLALTVGMLVVAIVAAVPLSDVAGIAIQSVLAIALVPMLVLGFLIGLDRMTRRVLSVVLAAAVIMLIAFRIFGGQTVVPSPLQGISGGQDRPSVADQLMTVSLGGLLLIAAVVSILILAAVWLERTRPPETDLVESRTIDRGDDTLAPRLRRRRFGRRHEPTGAVAAYVALMHDIDADPDVRRGPAETPAEHAGRLRSDRRATLSLDLLAADYALARYGGVELPTREDVRAVSRWRTLRHRLSHRPGGSRRA
jgi:hypothetical protein